MQQMASPKQRLSYEGLNKRAVEILRLLAQGMSDREIAERLTMTINTVKWYNRQIYNILGVGSRTQAIARAHDLQLLDEDSIAGPSTEVVSHTLKHNLPVETTNFIGRNHEKEVIKHLLGNTHLLTLVGPPGTGKTRLALKIGWEMADNFRDGAYFVALASVSDPTLVMNTIVTAVGVNETPDQPLIETLKRVLRERQMLLILDNFEHLLAAASQVSELLTAAPGLKVLATSREPLHLYGEQEYVVLPLKLPDLETPDPQTLAGFEATALFVQQAHGVRSDFELTAENALDVAQICIRLEGLPLAIELAAARSRLLTPPVLLARLSSRLDILTGGARDLPTRQQTLRNTIEWSYNLLDEGEKMLFARLAVFQGGWSLDAVEAIYGKDLPINVFNGLESLVKKSLVQQKELPSGEPRFTMLETLHEYAWERLEENGEAQTLHMQHAQYFVELAERAEPQFRQAQQLYWFRLLETEHENMRSVFQWSLSGGDITFGVRLVGALYLFWFTYGYHAEGQQWIQQLLNQMDNITAMYHPKLLIAAGHMTTLYDLELARHYLDQALHLYREFADKLNTAWALVFKGYSMMGEPEAALIIAEEGLSLFQELNHKPGIGQALHIIGNLALSRGDYERARCTYEESLVVSQETGETRRIRIIIGNLSSIAQLEGNYEHARQLAEQALRLALELNNRLDIAEILASLAGIIGLTGQPERATRLLGACEAVLKRMGAVPVPSLKPKYERNIAALHTQLDNATFEACWNEGSAFSLEKAVAYALELDNT